MGICPCGKECQGKYCSREHVGLYTKTLPEARRRSANARRLKMLKKWSSPEQVAASIGYRQGYQNCRYRNNPLTVLVRLRAAVVEAAAVSSGVSYVPALPVHRPYPWQVD